MKREALEKMTVKELLDIAKEKQISGRWNMKKTQLIDAILETEKKIETAEDKVEEPAANNEKYAGTTGKSNYIETVQAGTIIAFKIGDKVKSAMVEKRSTERKVLKVRTRVGEEHLVSYDDVVWVKTGRRWPKGVLNALKGVANE